MYILVYQTLDNKILITKDYMFMYLLSSALLNQLYKCTYLRFWSLLHFMSLTQQKIVKQETEMLYVNDDIIIASAEKIPNSLGLYHYRYGNFKIVYYDSSSKEIEEMFNFKIQSDKDISTDHHFIRDLAFGPNGVKLFKTIRPLLRMKLMQLDTLRDNEIIFLYSHVFSESKNNSKYPFIAFQFGKYVLSNSNKTGFYSIKNYPNYRTARLIKEINRDFLLIYDHEKDVIDVKFIEPQDLLVTGKFKMESNYLYPPAWGGILGRMTIIDFVVPDKKIDELVKLYIELYVERSGYEPEKKL